MAVVFSAMALPLPMAFLLFLLVGKTWSLEWDYSVVRDTGKCSFLLKMLVLLISLSILLFMILMFFYVSE